MKKVSETEFNSFIENKNYIIDGDFLKNGLDFMEWVNYCDNHGELMALRVIYKFGDEYLRNECFINSN